MTDHGDAAMQKLYHVTEKGNLQGILSQGLVPKIGPRSTAAGEKVPAVYLFAGLDAVSDGFLNWMERVFDDGDVPVLLRVEMPDGMYGRLETDGWEARCRETVPPGCIAVVPGYL